MTLDYSIAQIALLFFIYAFLGWCVEVIFAACREGRFVNRGFLNGPLCPIYGFGVVLVVLMLEPIGKNLPLLFLGSVAVTTGIEFIAGFLLKQLFHARWWDYSDLPMNIGGYVCPLFSLLWGMACMIVIRFVHPPIYWLVEKIPNGLMAALLSVFGVLLVVDMIATVLAIRSLNDRLKRLTELAAEIHALSDEIGMKISESTLTVKNKAEASGSLQRLEDMKSETESRIEQRYRQTSERIEQTKDATRARLLALRERFSGILDEYSSVQDRIIKAFPRLRSDSHQEALNALRRIHARRHREDRKKK